LDYKILEEFSSFNVWNSLEKNRTQDEVVANLSQKEKDIIDDHVNNIDSDFEGFKSLKNSGMANLIKMHHEKLNGKGFPARLSENELSDLECALIFSSNLFSLIEYGFKQSDGVEFFKNVLTHNDRDLGRTLGHRVQKLSINLFKSFDGAA